MSLLDDSMEKFEMMDRTTVPDGYGGYTTTWKAGAEIPAASVKDSSMEAKIAEKQGVTALYTITTRKNVNLKHNDIIRRVSDGKLFRITSDGDDEATPSGANLNMRQVSAEELDALPK